MPQAFGFAASFLNVKLFVIKKRIGAILEFYFSKINFKFCPPFRIKIKQKTKRKKN
jgi:hypothetical protein